jgi:hypothetical protein
MTPSEELRHINDGADPGEEPAGAGTIELLAHGDAEQLRVRAAEILIAVLGPTGPDWPTLEKWSTLLPQWFVDACAPEQSQQETEEWLVWWRSLPPDEQAAAEDAQPWSLGDWLHWFKPEERTWFWWDARVISPDTLRLIVQITDWPTPLGSLRWLLTAAGAREIDEQS